MQRLLIAVDGNSLMHRAFHAISGLTDQEGNPTNAIYGFISMLLKVLLDQNPSHLVIAFDMHGPTFRHEAYQEYKGTRKPTDELLRPQFPRLKAMLSQMGIAQIETPGFEADDILGTLAKRCEEEGLSALLVTGDRDSLQLVTERTHVLYTKRGISDTIEFSPEIVLEHYSVRPDQIPDLKGLMGDSSDNIPGIPGVGEKTATKLLMEYGTLENVLKNADAQKGKLKERLIEHKALAEMSLWLATISREAPLPCAPSGFEIGNVQGAREAFTSLGFASLLPRLSKWLELRGEAPLETPAQSIKQSPYGEPETLTTPAQIAAFTQGAGSIALHFDGDITLATSDRWAIIPIQQDLLSEGFEPDQAFAALLPLFAQKEALRVFDAKRLLHMLASLGINADGECIADDALLCGWLLNPLKPAQALADLIDVDETPDARALFMLLDEQSDQLAAAAMQSLYRDIELPLMRVLLKMEREGFLVDQQELTRQGEALTALETAYRAEIIERTGGIPFNINSPKQLGEVLFDRLGLPTGKKTKSGYSTDAETLEGLMDAHPVIEKILEFRQVAKLNATYITGLLSKIDSDGRVRSFFDQTATVTGRLSSNEPNLQNIPVRTPRGREIRRAFIAKPGYVLVDADYSQIELRILAHLSGDQGMIDAFNRAQDIHQRTAAEVYGVPLEEVTGQMRSSAKAVNFGIVYGISDFGLAKNIGVTRKEASEFIARYFARYPGVKKFMDSAVAEGKALGYTKTLLGRRRPLPELSSSNFNTRSFGERAAMNTPVQGLAADIIKLAMVRVEKELAEEALDARLILQVHDELIIECKEGLEDAVCALLTRCMEGVIALDVPIRADVSTGRTWFEAK